LPARVRTACGSGRVRKGIKDQANYEDLIVTNTRGIGCNDKREEQHQLYAV